METLKKVESLLLKRCLIRVDGKKSRVVKALLIIKFCKRLWVSKQLSDHSEGSLH